MGLNFTSTTAPRAQAHVTIYPLLGYILTDEQHADPILDNAFRVYFPALDPAYFSPYVLNFCVKSIDYLNKSTGVSTPPY